VTAAAPTITNNSTRRQILSQSGFNELGAAPRGLAISAPQRGHLPPEAGTVSRQLGQTLVSLDPPDASLRTRVRGDGGWLTLANLSRTRRLSRGSVTYILAEVACRRIRELSVAGITGRFCRRLVGLGHP